MDDGNLLTNRVLTVGGNAVSAFLSWRLSATNACDVTLVWKSGFEAVSQYGISFRSNKFGNERFKPRHVVRTPEDAAAVSRASFDYVLLCVKALPDVYDLASVIESVVSPQHTCILVNTTHTLGVESYLEQRFPTNVVLSLVSGAELSQIGASEFEHKGSTELWVGAANRNPSIPQTIQQDMAEALSMTLKSGSVDCEVSPNIRQQQYERMIGPIAFHPASVVFETPSHKELLEKTGVRDLVTGVIDELIALARAQDCEFATDFKERTMEQMIAPTDGPSTMYQDFTARRPMEIETYLGSPIKLAQEVGVHVPRVQTLYALLSNVNSLNQTRPPPSSAQSGPIAPGATPQPPMPNQRMSMGPGPRPGPGHGPGMRSGMRPGGRAPSSQGVPPQMRRGPPSMNGFPPPGRMHNGNGYGRGHPPPMQRRPSMEGNDLEEFSHLMLYDGLPEGAAGATGDDGYGNGAITPGSTGELGMRERELALRQKELALREREYNMRRRRGPMPPPPPGAYDDDDEGDDYFDPMDVAGVPAADADALEIMSVTSRRTRKTPSASQLRNNPEMMAGMGMPMQQQRQSRNPWKRPSMQNRTSASITAQMPGLRDQLMNDPLMGYSSDRYGNVDRMNMGQESRTNSLTAERLQSMQGPPPGPYGPPMSRRGSQSPGNPLNQGMRPPPPPGQRPSPPNGHYPQRPSPPGMRQPVPRHPPGHGNAARPDQVEQQAGVSHTLYPPKSNNGSQARSLTGSASASAGSGESHGSTGPTFDSEPSAHSSSSSLGPKAMNMVR
ncbi:hypothetical protein K431DRAFT_294472 [Polychaeton citri CBS 116435]|uniref:ApbA-domain-containing protein n=1 Tax=Polychaeton citri CBS 116435 TaxID=1314669 RepID=A0A9P4Q7I1_9PEZI|nr:hypothetical protein K431DRAFT_294472 [Polychaeton citri CBS 116435]